MQSHSTGFVSRRHFTRLMHSSHIALSYETSQVLKVPCEATGVSMRHGGHLSTLSHPMLLANLGAGVVYQIAGSAPAFLFEQTMPPLVTQPYLNRYFTDELNLKCDVSPNTSPYAAR